MRRRIFLFQTLTLILALVILLSVNGFVVHWVADYYRQQTVPASDGRAGEVQRLLDAWPEQDWDWPELARQLQALECGLVVEQDGLVVYSSLDEFQAQLYQRLLQDATWPDEGSLRLQNEG